MIHELKTWPGPFAGVFSGKKKHEIRKHDRVFDVGDVLVLREFDPTDDVYTGNEIQVNVTYLTPPGQWGLPNDVCVMSIERCDA
jgi:hypothetical protein